MSVEENKGYDVPQPSRIEEVIDSATETLLERAKTAANIFQAEAYRDAAILVAMGMDETGAARDRVLLRLMTRAEELNPQSMTYDFELHAPTMLAFKYGAGVSTAEHLLELQLASGSRSAGRIAHELLQRNLEPDEVRVILQGQERTTATRGDKEEFLDFAKRHNCDVLAPEIIQWFEHLDRELKYLA